MKFFNQGAELYVPDDKDEKMAIERTTHMGIGAHQDDLEIFAYDGINKCFASDDKWFLGVVVTNGAGSTRVGRYSKYTDEEMVQIRKKEQKKAAFLGEYGAQVLLDYASSDVKKNNKNLVKELKELILRSGPDIVYTHNLADKHDTHIGTVLRVIEAIREIPFDNRPSKLVGCEVWRSLDWLYDKDKIMYNVDDNPNISAALLEVFDSQISGGKRYDLATKGRRVANATYEAYQMVDSSKELIYAMDLTPLIQDDDLSIREYVSDFIDRFKDNVKEKIDNLS